MGHAHTKSNKSNTESPFFSSDVVSKAKVTSRGTTMGFSLAILLRGQVSGNQSSPSAKMADVGTTPKCTLSCRQSCSSGARHSVKTLEQPWNQNGWCGSHTWQTHSCKQSCTSGTYHSVKTLEQPLNQNGLGSNHTWQTHYCVSSTDRHVCHLFNECENSPGHTDSELVNVTECFCYYTAKCYLSELHCQ